MKVKEAQQIVDFVREIVASVAPDANEKVMYGGIVFELGYLTPKRLFCGVFVRKEYLTIEFDRGAELKDPKGLLEGAGKYRRHLKIRSMADVKTKKLKGFINQSFEL